MICLFIASKISGIFNDFARSTISLSIAILNLADLSAIVKIQLERVLKRLRAQGLELELTPAALEKLAAEGYDPAYGARPLKRVIQHRLLDPLSLDVLDGKFVDGDVIRADASHGEIVFAKA